MSIEPISLETLNTLHRRADLPPQTEAEALLHFGILRDGECWAAASIQHRPAPGVDNPHAWLLLSVCTHPQVRGQGLGRRVLWGVIQHIAKQRGTLLWTHAAPACQRFYHAMGFFLQYPELAPQAAPAMMWRTVTPADRFLEDF